MKRTVAPSQVAPRPPARPRVSLDQLHTFAVVAATEHIGAAADLLGQSQGSVSAAVARLEAALGLPLLQRVGRSVRLTDAGRAVRYLAERAVDDALAVERAAAGYVAFEVGRVTIASGRVSGTHLLAGWLAPFVERHPHVEVVLSFALNSELLGMLAAGTADVVVAGSPVTDPGLDWLLLHRTDLVAVVAAHHPLAGDGAAGLAGLARHRHLAHEPGTATHGRALQLLGGAHPGPELVLEESALHTALLAGLGFAVMPRSTIAGELRHNRLVALDIGAAPVLLEYRAVRRRGLQTPAASALWTALEAIALPV